MEHEAFLKEELDEELIEVAHRVYERAIRQFKNDLLKELRELHGHPMQGLRTALLERLRQKHPELTLEELNVFLKALIEPNAYSQLTD